jgi:hypothetical protein
LLRGTSFKAELITLCGELLMEESRALLIVFFVAADVWVCIRFLPCATVMCGQSGGE